MTTLLRPVVQALLPSGAKARLQVFIFHRVLERVDPLLPAEMDAQRFESVCRWLSKWFCVLPLDVACRHLQDGTLPASAACITFDDGYADNLHMASPILKRHGLTATFFIATGFLDGGRMWNDTVIEAVRACSAATLDLEDLGLGRHALGTVKEKQTALHALIRQIKYMPLERRVQTTEQVARRARVELPTNLMMTSAEVIQLKNAGMQIGAHTVSHPILAKVSSEVALSEISSGHRFLENLIDERVGLFAYPNGKPGEDYLPEHVDMVKSLGFDAAVSTQWGASTRGDDVFQIKRFTPWDRSEWKFLLRTIKTARQVSA